MDNFPASNGMVISPDEDGDLRVLSPSGRNTLRQARFLDRDDIKALREFFQAEADERLGRWRWSSIPGGGLDFVVTADVPECSDWDLTVTCEQSGESMHYTRADDEGTYPGTNYFADAARAYLDAHPEPKPWQDAKPGEVWELTLEGREPAAFYPSKSLPGHFTPVMPSTGTTGIDFEWPLIVAGRRIWPAEVSS